jgi:hypothetical protein
MQRGRLLAAEHSSEALHARLPSHFRQSLPAARVVTHKTEASIRVSPQSVGMEHLDAAVSPSHPSPRTSTPPSHAPNRHVPCPTQRTHAIGLWVARSTSLSKKDPFYKPVGLGKGYITKEALDTPW